MRTWERTRLVESCGNCGKPLAVGTPIQVLTLAAAPKKRRIRCEGCADGPLDVDALEAFDVAEEGRRSSKSVGLPTAFAFTGATRLMFDARAAQIKDSE